MLSSIHPLGERTRQNRWLTTVVAFTIGATGTGALIGVGLGWTGRSLIDLPNTVTWLVMGAVILAAGLLDAAKISVPGPRRQVNEHWIGTYRGWVYGGAFGLQLGAGVATHVVTWGVYAVFVLEFVSGSPLYGAAIGAVFGVGRSIGLLLAGGIDRASRLGSFHQRMNALGPPVRRGAAIAVVTLGLISSTGGWL